MNLRLLLLSLLLLSLGYWIGLLHSVTTFILIPSIVFAGIYYYFMPKPVNNAIEIKPNIANIQQNILNACIEADLKTLEKLSKSHPKDFLANDYETLNQLIRGNLLQAFGSFSYRAKEDPFNTCPPYYLGFTAKHRLSKPQAKTVIEFLLSHGLSHQRDILFKQFPLSTAIGFDNNPVALALIELVATQSPHILNDATKGRFPCTPLLLAIQKGNREVFDALLKTQKVNVNLPDSEHGLTPLHWAVIMGLPDMVERLILEGANVNALSNTGKTPLNYLSLNKNQIAPKIINGQPTLYSTQEAALKPIAVHFNNNLDTFLKMRNALLKKHSKTISNLLIKKAVPIINRSQLRANACKKTSPEHSITRVVNPCKSKAR